MSTHSQHTTANDEDFLRVNQVARRLGMSSRQVRRWIADGRLPAYRFGRAVRIALRDLNDFVRMRGPDVF